MNHIQLVYDSNGLKYAHHTLILHSTILSNYLFLFVYVYIMIYIYIYTKIIFLLLK